MQDPAEIAARRQQAGGASKVPVEVGLQNDDRLSVSGHARLRRRRPSTCRPARSRCAPFMQNADQVLLPGYFVRVRVPDGRAECPARARCRARQRPGRALRARSSTRTTWSSSARSRSVRRSASCARSRAGSSPRIASSSPASCARIPGQKVDPQMQTIACAGALPPARRSCTGAMISDFFIRRPVLANVLAILMVVDRVWSRCWCCRWRNIPTWCRRPCRSPRRYPGASARTVIDAVALPIEQQVNGVEGMIYMQSYSAADGSYSLTVTFKIGVDLNIAQVLVQNRVSSALSSLPQAVQAQGVIVQKNSTAILQIVTLTSPRRALRQPLSRQLRDHQAQGRDRPAARRRQRRRVRRRPVFDARLARSRQDAGARAGPAGRDPGAAAAERAGHCRARSARRRRRAGQSFQYTLNVAGKLSDSGRIRRR